MEIEAGTNVLVRTADGEEVPMVATGGRTMGRDFPVVWVCLPDEWESFQSGDAEAIPWPVEAVHALDLTGP
jgi:hypothetical protein